MVARQKVAQLVVLQRPAVPDHAQPLEGRPVAGLPVIQQVGQDRVELLFRRVPGLVQVVVDARGIDGPDGCFGVGVGGQQHPPRIGIECARALQKVHAGHARHALIAQQQRHRLLAGLQLRQRIQGRLAAGRPHHSVDRPVLPAQVLYHRFQHAYVVIHRQ